jgi:RecJ-like exonuclease
LGEIMQISAEKYSGRGGGHDIAAGAQLPVKNIDEFIKMVNDLTKKQLAGKQIGG